MEAKFLLAVIAVVAVKEGAAVIDEVSGTDVTVLSGRTAMLKCLITKAFNETDKPIYVWKDSTEDILFFDERVVQADRTRMSVSMSKHEMTVEIKDVVVSDEDEYKCSVTGVGPTASDVITLTVNQYPKQFYVTNIDAVPQDGDEESVAKCITKGSKPEPKMWFTDPDGEVIALIDNPEILTRDNGLVDKNITLKKTFTKSDNGKKYQCHVERADGTTDTIDTARINVHFSPSVTLEGMSPNFHVIQEEGTAFEARCRARGNPTPTITWKFAPDVNTNISLPIGENLPRNLQSKGGRIFSNGLLKSTVGSTNNGTFTCTADNGIGSPASVPFSLEVYAAPVTTVPTTTESTPVAEPRTAGSNGAVIGGVVAVAAFVIIVAVLLIARYFMSHKGTYRTKETKFEEADEKGDPAADEDEEFLAERKKTEYFL